MRFSAQVNNFQLCQILSRSLLPVYWPVLLNLCVIVPCIIEDTILTLILFRVWGVGGGGREAGMISNKQDIAVHEL